MSRLPLRWPLPATTLLTAALLVGPAVALWWWPRPRAEGLERLLPQVSLLQSFPVAPERPAPPLWRQRLGERQATRLWRQQRGVWWQFWGRDGDGGAFLAVPHAASSGQFLPSGAIAVDDLLVLAPDPLSRRQLQDQLRGAARQRRGLERRCLERLRLDQAVYWSPIGLAELTGPLAPLLQQARQGCLSLTPSGRRLSQGLELSGEVAASPGVLGDPPLAASSAVPPPLAPGTLLQVEGPGLAPLLESLVTRQLIREPLAARYGLAEPQLRLLTGVPFRLRLRTIPRGPFQAALELQLAVGRDRRPWAALLRDLRQGLLRQGLQEAPARLTPTLAGGGLRSQTLPAASFLREDGAVLGGWRWQAASGGEPQLLLFLGPISPRPAPPLPRLFPAAPLTLQLKAAALDRLGLLPAPLPLLVRRAGLLELSLAPADQPLSRLTGRLRLTAGR